MDESRVNNFQRRQLTSHMLRTLKRGYHLEHIFLIYRFIGGESLPEKLGPSSTQTKAPAMKRVESSRSTR